MEIFKKVESHFNRNFKEFDAFYDEKKGISSKLINALFRRSMKLRFDKVIEIVSSYENTSVLDVGCGTGRYSTALVLKGIKKYLGIDFSKNMIEEARNCARLLKLDHVCHFVRADFIELNIDETFDFVFAMGVLDYIEHPVPFVKKMVQLARKSVMISFSSTGGIIQWFRKHIFLKIKNCPIFFYSKEDVTKIALQTGGRHFTIDKLAKDYFLTITLDQ